jgi:hypothetical protein
MNAAVTHFHHHHPLQLIPFNQWLDTSGFGILNRLFAFELLSQLACFVSLHSSLYRPCDAGAATADVEAALVSRSMCDGQGLLASTTDTLIALQLPTPALRLLHASLDALR